MIAIVIVNFNGAADTIECLEGLLRLRGDDRRVIIVDNASSDGSIERISDWANGEVAFEPPGNVPWASLAAERRRDPELVVLDVATAKASAPSAFITLVRSPANLGFAGANNIGIVHALNDAACTHVWLLNNDTVTDPNAGRVLHAFSDAHPDVGIVAATLLYYHLPDKIQATGSHYSPLRVNGYPINQ